MKYILTLLLSSLLVTATFAQTDAEKEEAKRVILGDKKGTTTYPKSGDDRTVYGGRNERYPQQYPARYPTTSRERRIYEINREYDAKIYSIRQNRTLSNSEKERMIRQLEADRRRKINALSDDYYKRNRRYDDNDDYKKSKKHKGNNGNHYGWQKGKGNPHKNDN
jgi:hypothetical protein